MENTKLQIKQITRLKLSDITIPKESLIKTNNKNINTMAHSIREIGLINPIIVNKYLEIKAGNDRYFAHVKLNMTYIDCIIIDTDDEILLKQIEIDENLKRKELSYVDKTKLLSAEKKIYEKKYPTSTRLFNSQNNGKNIEDRVETVESFIDTKSNDLNCSSKTISNAINQHDKIIELSPELMDNITKIDKSKKVKGIELEKISKLNAKEMAQLSQVIDEKIEAKEKVSISEILVDKKTKEDNLKSIFMLDLYNTIKDNPKYTSLKNKIDINFEEAQKVKNSKKVDYSSMMEFIFSNI